MGKYKVTDPQTGQSFVLTGDSEPTEEELNAIFSNDAKGTALAEEPVNQRPNMWKALAAEGAKQPKGVLAREKQLLNFGLKGAAALGQSIEGGVSAPVVAMQRGQFNPLDIAKTTMRSISGEAPTELGDIGRNLGLPEPVNQIGGLIASGFLPGFGTAKKAAGLAREGIVGLAEAIKNKGVSAVARFHLPIVARVNPEAAAYSIANKFKFVNPGETAEQIEGKVTKAVDKVREAAQYVQRRASRFQGVMLRKHGNDLLDVGGVVTETRRLANNSNLYLKDAAGQIAVGPRGKIALNNIPGNVRLQSIVGDIDMVAREQGGKLSVNQIKGYQKRLRAIAGKEDYKEVHAVANALNSGLSEATHKIPDVKKADEFYALTQEAIQGSERKGKVGVESLYHASATGTVPAEDYFKLHTQAKNSLSNLENMKLPARKRFLTPLKDAVAAREFESYKPQAGISLLGLGAGIAKPGMLPAVGAAIGLSSKRASGLLYRGLMGKLEGTPAQNAIAELVNKNLIDPAIVRKARETVMDNSSEQ